MDQPLLLSRLIEDRLLWLLVAVQQSVYILVQLGLLFLFPS
jgi:hypothetical protein